MCFFPISKTPNIAEIWQAKGLRNLRKSHQLWGVLQVLLTDLDEVTPLLEFNVALNRARGLKMDVKVGFVGHHIRHCTWMFQIHKDHESI